MKNIYALLFTLLVSTVGYAGNTYYWSGTAPITSIANWWVNQNGTGGHPPGFTTSGDVFWVANSNATTTLTAAWTLGAGVTLHIGSGIVTPINGAIWNPTIATTGTFIISGGTTIVERRATLQLGTSASPTFAATQGDSSNIIYTAGGSIPSGISYGNLIISASTPSFATGTITVQRSLYITGGTLTMAASAVAPYTINIADSMVISSGGAVIVAGANSVTLTATVGRDLIWRGTAAKAIYFQSTTGAPANTAILQVNGNVISTGGASNAGIFVDWGTANNYGANMYMGIKGNYTHSGVTRNYLQGSFDPLGFVFNGTGTAANPQIINFTSSGWSGNPYSNIVINSGTYVKLAAVYPLGNSASTYKSQFRVLSGGTLDCGATGGVSGGATTAGGGFQADAGSTIVTANAGGISASITAVLTTATGLSSGANYVFNGSSGQVTSSIMPSIVAGLTISNSSSVTLTQNTTVSNLTFNLGKLIANGKTITVTSGVTGGGTSSYVNTSSSGGTLVRTISGSTTTLTYDVGDNNGYAPVALTFSPAATSGSMSIVSKAGQHPNFATSTFGSSTYANHYWTVNNISMTGPSTVSAVFNYNNAGDVVGGSNTSFVAQSYALGAWSGTLTTANNASPAYSTVSALPFSSISADYQIGAYGPTVNPSPTSISFGGVPILGTSATFTTNILAYYLTPSSGNLTVTAPTNFLVYNGTSWVSSYTIPYTGGGIASPVTIQAQFTPPTAGVFSGNITITGGGLPSASNIAVSGNGMTTYYSKSTGNLDVLSNWGINTDGTGTAPSSFSGTGDIFNVFNNATPTIGANWSINGVTVNVGNGITGVNFTIPSGFSVSGTGVVNVGASSTLTITNATVPNLGTMAATSTVVFNSASAQTIPAATFGNVVYSGSSNASHSAGTTTVQGNYTISSGLVTVASTAAVYNVNIAGSMTISGTGAINMASVASASCFDTVTIAGSLTCSGTASGAGTGATTQTLINFQSASGVPSTSVLIVNGNVSNTGTATNFLDWGNLSSATATTNSSLIVKGNLTAGGASRFYYLGNGLGGYVIFAGTSPQTFTYSSTYPTGTNAGSGSNIQYVNFVVNSGASVVLSGTLPLATATGQPSSFSVLSGGTLDMGATAVISGGSTVGGFALSAGGTLVTANAGGVNSSITATLNATTGLSTGANYSFNGGSGQVTGTLMPATVNKLTAGNSSGVTLTQNTAVSTLAFTSGTLIANGKTITVTSGVTGAGTSSYVNTSATSSTLVKPVAGLSSVTYEVGNTTYTPATLALSSAGTGGSIGVQSRNGQQPNYSTSGLDASNYTNKYWTVTNYSAAGPSTIDVTFNYNNSGDVVGGTNAGFFGKKYAASAWSGVLSTVNNSSPVYSIISGMPLSSIAGDYQLGFYTTPLVTASPPSIAFGAVTAGTTSGTQSTNILASYLSPTSGNLTVTAPSNFQVFDGSSWVTSYNVPYSGGGISTPIAIQAQFNAPATSGAYSGNITISGGGLSSALNIGVSGNAVTKYYSKSTGNLDVLTNWGTNTDGSGAAPGSFTNVGDSFIIVNNFTPTIGAAWTITGVNVVVGNGTDAINFTIPSGFAVSGTGVVNVKANAKLTVTNASVPNLGNLAATSTVVFNSSSAQTIPVATYGNLIYSGSSTTTAHAVGTTTVQGNYTISSGKVIIAATASAYTINIGGSMTLSGTGALVMANVAGSACAPTVNITGNLNCSSSAATEIQWHAASGAAPTAVMQVNGNVTDNNTSAQQNFIDWGNATALGPNSYLGIKGNLSLAGNNRMYLLGSYSAKGVVFNGSGTVAAPQTFSWTQAHTLAVSNGYSNYYVSSGTCVKMLTNMRMGTNTSNVNYQNIFEVMSGGTLDIGTFAITDGNNNGANGFQADAGATIITSNAGGLVSGITAALSSVGLSPGVNYIFNAATTTPFLSGISSNAPASVTVNTGEVKANFTFSPTGTVTVAAGATLNMNGLVLGGTFTPANSGTIKTQNTGATPLPSGKVWGGTVEYNNTTGGQTLVSGTYNNLTNSNTGSVNTIVSGGSVTVSGDLTLTAGSILSDNGVLLNLSGNILGTGKHISSGSGAINMTGSNKTISAATVANLTLNNSGGFSLAGSTVVTGILTLQSGTLSLLGYDLTLNSTASVSGSFSSLAMIVADNTGKLIRKFAADGSFTFPVGDQSGNYSPATVSVTGSAYSSADIRLNLRSVIHPSNANTNNYIKRYWSVNTNGITGVSYSLGATYTTGDVVGTESLVAAGKYTGSIPWTRYGTTNTATHTLTATSISDANVAITGISSQNPTVSVGTLPSAAVCAGNSITLSASATSDGGLNYTWTPAANLSSSTAAGVVATAAVGSYIYSVTVTDGNGFSATNGAAITIAPYPSVSFGTNPSVCQPISSVSLPYTSVTGSPATYNIAWDAAALAATFGNVSGAALTSPLSINIPTAVTGSYSGNITVANTYCTSVSYPFSITVYEYPTASITSAVVPCMGDATGIVFSGTPGATVRYAVDGNSAVNSIMTGGTYTLSTGSLTTPHTYHLLNAHNPACTNVVISRDSTINPIPQKWMGGTASFLNDWQTVTNWTCGRVPLVTDDVTVDGTYTYVPQIAPSSVGTVRNLSISSAAQVIIGAGGALNVTGNVTNKGAVAGDGKLVLNGSTTQTIDSAGAINNLEINNANGAVMHVGSMVTIGSTLSLTAGTLTTNDSLLLESGDMSGTARIAPIATGAAIANKVIAHQYIQGGYRRFRFWSHPFTTNISLGQLQSSIDITGQGGAAHGFTTTGSNAPSAFRYDPYTSNSSLSYDPGWKPFTDISASADATNTFHRYQGLRVFMRGAKGEGLGYWFGYTPSATVIGMTGTVNQGSQTISLSKGSSSDQDYNMVGNPYPSPVDLGAVIYNASAAGQVTGSAFYVWNPSLGASGQFQAITINSVTPYNLPAYTAFQVRADHDGATLHFTESHKSATATNYLFKAQPDAISLYVYDAGYHPYDMLYVKFNDEASEGEDKYLDATKPSGADFNFYSLSADNKKMVIDARPYDVDKVVPLGISSAYPQDFIIKAESVVMPAGAKVYLHDKLLQKYIALEQGAEYRFTISKDKATQGDNRFELAMKPGVVTETKGLQVTMAPNPATDEVKVVFVSGQEAPVTVRVLDMSGVSMYNEDMGVQQKGMINIPLSRLASGIYMVEITSGSQKVVQRLVKE